MNNSLLPSVSSQLYSFGSNEPISDINPMLMDSEINLYGSSFCIDSRLCNDHDQISESYAIPSQSSNQPGPPSLVAIKRLVDYPNVGADSLTNKSNYIPQQPFSLGKSISIPQYEVEFKTMENGKKRSKSCATEWTRNKKVCFGYEKQWDHQAKEEGRDIPSDKVPARRSRKLSDRVTALQKLVSPFGKTDTASVLQEASISIKLLQDQIQNLFDRQNTSFVNKTPLDLQKTEDKQLDLRGRGLCLVPISLTQKLTMEDQFNQY